MAKNFIQRMQQGGPAIRLEQYVPGQYLEKALGDVVEYHKFNRELEEEKRQFDEQADLEKDRLSIMSNQAESTSRYQQGQLRLEDEKLKRTDWREFGSKMPPRAQLAYARANDMPADIVAQANTNIANFDKFQDEYRKLRQDPKTKPEDWKEFKSSNVSNFAMFKPFSPKLEDDINSYYQGSMNKNLLINIAASNKFVEQMNKIGISPEKWKDLSPEEATYHLQQLPTWISTGLQYGKLGQADKELTAKVLGEALKYSAAAYQSSAEFDPDLASTWFENMNNIMRTQFESVEGLDDLEIKDPPGAPGDLQLSQPEIDAALDEQRRTGVITIGTGDAKREKPIVFDAGSNYRIEITNAAGEKLTRTVEGGQAASIQKQKGWKISKSDKIIKPFKMGRPQLDSEDVIKDTKTGKTLTFVGFDFPPEEQTVTAGGKKIKRTRAMPGILAGPRTGLSKLTGGQKVFYFKDEAGKSVIYTPAEVTRATFIEPPAGQQEPEEAPIVAEGGAGAREEDAGGWPEWGGGVLEGAIGADIGGRDEHVKGQVDSVQSAIDLFLREDEALQELEDNE
jgi:hypothetical protein